MKRLTILVDMDGTIENLCEAWVEFLNERHGTTVTLDDIVEWDMTKAFPALTSQQIFAPLKEEALWQRVKPLPKAYDNLVKLKYDGHKVLIATTSNPDTVPLKLKNVLFKYFPFFTYNDVIITSHKQLLRGDVLVDDGVHNLIGGSYARILMTASHNRTFDAASISALRANDWDEVYEIISTIAEKEDTTKHGYWDFRVEGTYMRTKAYCSVCGKHSGIGGIKSNQAKPYCPNCGATMDLKQNN